MGQVTSFFISSSDFEPSQLIDEKSLGKELLQHLKARRLEVGERVDFMNGEGAWLECVCRTQRPWVFEILDRKQQEPLWPDIELCLSPPKKEALWDTLAQATEMGATRLRFLESEHSQHRRQDRPALLERARRVADAACEQSHRSWRLEIAENWATVEEALALPGVPVVADEDEAQRGGLGLSAALDPKQTLRLFVGPEGGWSEAEQKRLRSAAVILGLGSQILRVPTAVVASLHHLKCAVLLPHFHGGKS